MSAGPSGRGDGRPPPALEEAAEREDERSRSRFVLLGRPVRHSVSSAIHASAFQALGLRASYGAREVTAEELAAAMRELARRGGGNVTLPHKERAAEVLDVSTEAVRATGACNCFWGTDGAAARHRQAGEVVLAGDNTDVGGFLDAVAALPLADGLEGARVLLLGAGGAARAVVHACLSAKVERIDIRNRTHERAEAVARRVGAGDSRVGVLRWEGPMRGSYDLAVNATSLGLRPSDPQPPAPETLDAAAVIDLVYAPGGTPWSRRAAAHGLPSADGLEMLVRQASRSIQRWFPGEEPPLDVLRAAARAALEEASGRPSGRRSATP